MIGRRSPRPGHPLRRGSMRWMRAARGGSIALVVGGALLGGVAGAADGPSHWNSAGGNLQNTRFQANEKTFSVMNVAQLEVKWSFTTGGDVSATPAVDIAELSGPFRVEDGVAASSETGLALTSSVGEAEIQLRFDLLAWLAELQLDARVAGSPSAQPPSVRLIGAPGRLREAPAAVAPPARGRSGTIRSPRGGGPFRVGSLSRYPPGATDHAMAREKTQDLHPLREFHQ